MSEKETYYLYSLKKKRELEYMKLVKGAQSIAYDRAPYLISSASVVGKKEGAGPIGEMFDLVGESDLFGENTWEEAESTMQREACLLAMGKAHVSQKSGTVSVWRGSSETGNCNEHGSGKTADSDVRALRGVFNIRRSTGIGIYECGSRIWRIYTCSDSSHFGSAEKEFRFPLSYANQRPLSAHWTVTGSGAFLVGKKESHVRISGLTVGKIVDYGLKDSQNMGACMAPAACNTIWQNLQDFGRSPEDYSRIITGDLGYVGQSILFDLLLEKGYDIRGKHLDCGMTIFDQQTQDTHAGGSGCGCAATVLSAYILPKIERGEWERVLFVPTGALMSTVSYNEGASVPGIAHAIVLEHEA